MCYVPELDSTVHDRCLFAAQVSFNLAVDEYHLVWLPTGEWLYVRLEVGALSVNALWALRAGRWGWRYGLTCRPPYLYIGCLLARGLEVGHRSSRRILVLRSSCSS